jgi:hypothetical protein
MNSSSKKMKQEVKRTPPATTTTTTTGKIQCITVVVGFTASSPHDQCVWHAKAMHTRAAAKRCDREHLAAQSTDRQDAPAAAS